MIQDRYGSIAYYGQTEAVHGIVNLLSQLQRLLRHLRSLRITAGKRENSRNILQNGRAATETHEQHDISGNEIGQLGGIVRRTEGTANLMVRMRA